MTTTIRISDRSVRFPRATISPDFEEKRVIASSPWEFVSLWLRQRKRHDACVYWEQAKAFYESARDLPVESAPLPLYYAFLNASKALLECNGVRYSAYHGVTGLDLRTSVNGRIRIDNEGISIKQGGFLPALIQHLGEIEARRQYNLGEILSNLAFIHRSVAISYSRGELFLSIKNPRYVHHNGRAWFRANLQDEHTHGQTLATIPAAFSTSITDRVTRLESVATFPWSGARRPTSADIAALKDFHRSIRLDINYIASATPLWYVKRTLASYTMIRRYNLTLMFLAMHRLSEIARYKPIELIHILEGRRNWIIYEFVKIARNQFLDEIAAEITGYEISPAGVRQSSF
ncbi:YaaC family protein [Mesorhizobium australicum]|uniref:YaaC family protein n=1 Tax=Mesorhizobium australicum TaxID=536018 RepID=UPI00333CCE9F